MKKNTHQLLFIGSLEVLRIKLHKNRIKTVGFLVGLSKTIKLVFITKNRKESYKQHVSEIWFHIYTKFSGL